MVVEKVYLLEGMFNESQLKGKEYLLYLDVDRLIAPCYEAAGQKAKKERYGGWEKTPIAGHSIGHWLSAAANMYHVTGDKRLKEKLNYALAELAHVQSYDTDGYVSGFPRDCFDKVFTGEFEVDNFSLAGSWVPWYSIHKIYAGLIDAYQLLNMEKALQIVTRLADWAYNGLINLSEDQFQKMLVCEHGGMNEAFADLYDMTKNPNYLELAERFYHQAVLDPLDNQLDELEGKHANTQIPKVIGVAKLFNITGKEKYKRIATFFWEQVTNYRTYAIGGNSIREHFGPENAEELGILTTETCNTYNMLKLTELLFEWEHHSKYYDFFEKALYNHILASQDPESGMKTYFVSSEPGHFKVYNSRDDSFWCCTGTGMENPARYNRGIFSHHDDRQFFINLFISARAVYEDRGLIVRQETGFPYKEESSIFFEQTPEEEFDLLIRIPYWVKDEMTFMVNGEQVEVVKVNGYAKITRIWQQKDCLTVVTPLCLHRYVAKDDEQKQVIMYGPIVLAGALGRENFPETDILSDHLSLNNHPLIEVPALVTDQQDLEKWIQLVDPDKLIFTTTEVGQPGNQSLTLKPFYDIHHERYTIYWNILSKGAYEHFVDNEKDRRLREQRITIDVVTPHEQQPEVDHNMEASLSTSAYKNVVHSGYREAKDGGYFSYEMKIDASKSMYLAVTYFGGDGREHMDGRVVERDFTIWIDENELTRQKLTNQHPGELFTEVYPIPFAWMKEKETIRVKFQSSNGKIAGGIYRVRIINEPEI
ncbi:beta-L-arabinofuranosidase domain-containing protein [Gracilibacillus dipsosauri]|uniref:beta-L-arabinofuranosidase domain-containing protein n=1 Tax=Gracilibacillus dipsosauri TaxID=178340 RepID=UPI0032429722